MAAAAMCSVAWGDMNKRSTHKTAFYLVKKTRTSDGAGGDVESLNENGKITFYGRLWPLGQSELPEGLRSASKATHACSFDNGITGGVARGNIIRNVSTSEAFEVDAVLTGSDGSQTAYCWNIQKEA